MILTDWIQTVSKLGTILLCIILGIIAIRVLVFIICLIISAIKDR